MADGKALGPLLKSCRKQAGLTQEELASEAKCSRSWLAGVENGKVRPRLDTVIALAELEILDADPAELGLAWLRDSLGAQSLDHVRRLDAYIDARQRDWSAAALRRIRVRQADVKLRIDDKGGLFTERKYRGCTTEQHRDHWIIREQIVGEQPSRIEVTRSPTEYELSSKTVNGFREHMLKFPDGWEEDAIDIALRTELPGAYLLGDGGDEYKRRLAEDPAEPYGFVSYVVRYAIEKLTISLRLDPAHKVEWLTPVATPDVTPLRDQDYTGLSQVSRSASWRATGQTAKATMIRPVPSHSIFLRWSPR